MNGEHPLANMKGGVKQKFNREHSKTILDFAVIFGDATTCQLFRLKPDTLDSLRASNGHSPRVLDNNDGHLPEVDMVTVTFQLKMPVTRARRLLNEEVEHKVAKLLGVGELE